MWGVDTGLDPREAPTEGEELRRLAPLRLPLWHAQYVQGVSRDVPLRRRAVHVSRHGFASPSSVQDDPRKRRRLLYNMGVMKLTNALQILKVVEVDKTDDIRRPYIKQLMTKDLKFPLPHRNPPKQNKKIFAAKRPATFY